jgi:hypothetical protein
MSRTGVIYERQTQEGRTTSCGGLLDIRPGRGTGRVSRRPVRKACRAIGQAGGAAAVQKSPRPSQMTIKSVRPRGDAPEDFEVFLSVDPKGPVKRHGDRQEVS